MTRNEDKLYATYLDAKKYARESNTKMCDEWNNDFNVFKAWALNQGYEYDNEQFSYFLQRKDKTKDYQPDNCFFRAKGKKDIDTVTNEYEKLAESEKDKLICDEYINKYVSTRELAEKYGVCQATIAKILKKYSIKQQDRKLQIINLPGEIWKDVKDFEGLYQVSNLGRVKSISFSKGYGEKEMIQNLNAQGYKTVNLSKNGISKYKKIHRLVAEAFIPNPNNYEYINHKNEHRYDNRLENLEWCSQEYNARYSTGMRIVSEDIITHEIKEYNSISEVEDIGIDPSNVVKCLKGKRKSTAGKLWRYKDETKERDPLNFVKTNDDELQENVDYLHSILTSCKVGESLEITNEFILCLAWCYKIAMNLKDKNKVH